MANTHLVPLVNRTVLGDVAKYEESASQDPCPVEMGALWRETARRMQTSEAVPLPGGCC